MECENMIGNIFFLKKKKNYIIYIILKLKYYV